MSVLEIEGVCGGYGDAEILRDIDLAVNDGEIVTIIGPNGAGKSTLLKAVMGYANVTAGRIVAGGHDVARLQPFERVGHGIAYVPQLENVFPSLSVEENLRMGGYTLGKAEVRRRMERQYETFPRVAERRRQRVRTLSGGERQMLAMARALMTEPELLLLDEPSAALSPALVEVVFDTVGTINAQGRAIVLVEQEALGALQISHRGYAMVDGRNAFDGAASQILNDEQLRRTFLGEEAA